MNGAAMQAGGGAVDQPVGIAGREEERTRRDRFGEWVGECDEKGLKIAVTYRLVGALQDRGLDQARAAGCIPRLMPQDTQQVAGL